MGVAAPAQVPDAVAPPPGNRRFPLLDGMRAIAVLSVLLVHVAFFSSVGGDDIPGERFLFHLNIGVTIFFLISGFVLYRPLVAHRIGGPRAPALGDYARRRFLRIVPAYWLLLIALAIIPGLTGVAGGDWLAQFALVHTLPVGGTGDCVQQTLDCGAAQTWSLVVEVTFYAALPLYAPLAERLARGRTRGAWMRNELLLLAAIAVVSVLLHYTATDGSLPSVVSGTLIGYMLWFGLGLGLAVVSVGTEGHEDGSLALRWIAANPLPIWLAAIAAYVGLCLYLPSSSPFLFVQSDARVAHVGFGLVALLAVLPAIFGDRYGGVPRRLLAAPVVAWLGLVSYGIFLWHFVIAQQLGTGDDPLGFWPMLAATLGISVAVAAASYYLLERPLLRFKYRRGQ